MKRALVPLALSALGGCLAPPYLQSPGQNGVPGFYRPGVAAPAEPVVYGQPVAGSQAAALYPRTPASAELAPQELPREQPETWLESVPVAGPAPRNVESGGQMSAGLVPADPQGAAQFGAGTHGIEPTDSGRLYILELYQEVLDQRDALELEIQALQADLEHAQQEIARLSSRANDGEGRAGMLEQELAGLRSENQDLTARLTTAQIRRLEAEKLLLETKIGIERARAEAAAVVVNGVAAQKGH